MTGQTAIDVFAEAIGRGIKLSFEPPSTLHVDPCGNPCPDDFADTLTQHKAGLIGLLQLPFVMADSKILDETIFFCQDEQTRDALIEAGAEGDAIYTRDELKILLEQNRAKPFTAAELRKLHDIKQTFGARIGQ
jgi:hypothetical protein